MQALFGPPVWSQGCAPHLQGMEKTLLWIGLALVALWVVLNVTEAVVGGLLWIIFIAGVVMIGLWLFRTMKSRGSGPTTRRHV